MEVNPAFSSLGIVPALAFLRTDGRTDLVTPNHNLATLSVFINNGTVGVPCVPPTTTTGAISTVSSTASSTTAQGATSGTMVSTTSGTTKSDSPSVLNSLTSCSNIIIFVIVAVTAIHF